MKTKATGRECKVHKIGYFVSSSECKRIWITNIFDCVFHIYRQSWRNQTATILLPQNLASGNDMVMVLKQLPKGKGHKQKTYQNLSQPFQHCLWQSQHSTLPEKNPNSHVSREPFLRGSSVDRVSETRAIISFGKTLMSL